MSQRDFSKLNEDVLFGRANGQIIWQPRIECWFDDKMFEDGELKGRYHGMDRVAIYKDLGCSARPYEFNDCFYRTYAPEVKQYERQLNETDRESVIETPVGKVSQILRTTPSSWAKRTVKEWVTCEEDMKVFAYLEDCSTWHWNQEHYEKMLKKWDKLGAPTIFMPRVNVQDLYIDLMGVEEATYALVDYPDVVEEFFRALGDSHMRMINVINQSPIKSINFGDNIHSGTLSPSLFKKYVLPEYQRRCEKLHEAGKFVYAHFDGDNRGLTQFYQETGLDGIEAITPKPQGDITLEEAKAGLGDNMFLVDGIPAVYFDEIYPVETLVECVHKIIDLFAPHLVLGISDEISSHGDIERIRIVGEIVDEYNAKITG